MFKFKDGFIRRLEQAAFAATPDIEKVVAKIRDMVTGQPTFDLAAFFDSKAAWSRHTFGVSYPGVLRHLRKEVDEVAAKPSDLEEWVDVVALAMDGASRHAGATGEQFVAALRAKHEKNLARTWAPSGDGTIEHVKETKK